MSLSTLVASIALLAQDDKFAPKGPGDWSAKNWIGFVLYIAVFLAVVAFIFYIGRDEEEDAEQKG